MSRLDNLFVTVHDGAKEAAKQLFKDCTAQAVEDTKSFLNASRADLQLWTAQLSNGELSKTEFKDLVRGQRDLAKLFALTQAGIGFSKLERFRTKIVNLVIDAAI